MEPLIVILLVLSLALNALVIFLLKNSLTKRSGDKELMRLDLKIDLLSKKLDGLSPVISDEFRKNRHELSENFSAISKTVDSRVKELQLSNEKRLDTMRETVDFRTRELQKSNEKKLDEMRETVDEKLKESVEKRFNESFKTISGQLTQVYQGLGEMKNLATGVGDLKKVMEGVKTRGIYGEVQLGAIIEDILTPAQYRKNTITKKGSTDRVEFAVRMPGKDAEVLLPIDSKFPTENYQRLLSAYESGEKPEIEKWRKELAKDVRTQAKKIHDKYIEPPRTTDFGMMFLPTESLYAEVLRIEGLDEEIRQKFKISLCSPTTLPVVLNGLLMGYRSVAIEKRSAEVWSILGNVKTQFSKFGDLLEGVEKKLSESAKKIEDARKQSRRLEKELKDVETLPASDQSPKLTP